MSSRPPTRDAHLPSHLLELLDTDNTDAGLAELGRADLASLATAEQLIAAALERAEAAPETATHWLAIAEALHARLAGQPGMQAQIAYAQARLCLRAGDLDSAERLIYQSQSIWRAEGSHAPLARSYLGLTQIFAMRGRYAEAEEAIQTAIAGLPSASPQQAQARINLANLLRRQERHADALAEYSIAQSVYAQQLQNALAKDDTQAVAQWQGARARLAVNQANALMSLDRPDEAENALQDAAARFAKADDRLNQGRTYTNLGTLYVRTGRYSQALSALGKAAAHLLEETSPAAQQAENLRQADVLFLERANAYVALNLIAEAIQEIEQAIRLFETTQQPYELGQSYYSLGLLRLRSGQERLAQAALEKAQEHFVRLDNGLWQNRVALAQAALTFQQGDVQTARVQVDSLLGQSSLAHGTAHAWDTGLRVEAWLLEVHLALAQNDVDAAQQAATQAALLLGIEESSPFILPHLRLQWEHLTGCIALAAGNVEQAIEHFQIAIHMLESQRVSLPLEEFKSAYLEDKQDVYSDLFFSILDRDSQTSDGGAAQAFAIGEQARARSLLERLTAAGEGIESQDDSQEQQAQQLRRELHWLYNQSLDNTKDEQLADRRQEIESKEAALQRVEWKRTPLVRQAEAVDLAAFQSVLEPDQQALVYFTGRSPFFGWNHPGKGGDGSEVMAFVIDRQRVELFRNLTTVELVRESAAELRFQLGRVELGWAYVERHWERLMAGVRAVLANLYRQLIAPLSPALGAERLLFVPHGPLHQIPLHSLWDGGHYLLERFECSYAPSGSLAVHSWTRRDKSQHPYTSWAGLALTDPAIPAAKREVQQAAKRFAGGRLFMDGEANRQGLREAASADILHLATHGLFRPDNPFFSALKLADGWIDVREIYRLPLAARLVVLSACESGIGRVRGGDEVIGLARGFLGAGAHSLLVSLWNVHDESAADITDRFYFSLQKGETPAASLRSAQQLAVLAGQHPYFWAPFLMIG